MTGLARIKEAAITANLYRPARWIARRLRPRLLRQFRADVALYRSLITPGSLCFDVGANVGEKTEAMLKSGARVVAFEPSRGATRELRARCGNDRNCQIVEAAVGAEPGFATLYAAGESGHSSLLADWASVTQSYCVPVMTLDQAISAFGLPNYCKIDVEGWEPEVFRGLSRTLPLVSFEFHLTPRDIERARKCLECIASSSLDDGWVNLTPAESAGLHFADWMPLKRFREWFPGDLRSTLPGDPYGDIFVRQG